MKELDWQVFWASYRTIEMNDEKDLFIQVGKTVNKEPVSETIFMLMLEDIVLKLNLSKPDVLLELCCGNGLLTKPLSEFSAFVYAFDFTNHLIETAKQFKQKENIIYKKGDAKTDFFALFNFQKAPNKYLMNDSLGYFSPKDLEEIIKRIISKSAEFKFYITGIPSDGLKWNFYNTAERKATYLKGIKERDLSNNGMGRWWLEGEFETIAQKFNLRVTLSNQPAAISNYRMNVLFEKE
ncbi:MAG: class I SAM-dependent methyltransferase [Bacteroidota bacterium]